MSDRRDDAELEREGDAPDVRFGKEQGGHPYSGGIAPEEDQ